MRRREFAGRLMPEWKALAVGRCDACKESWLEERWPAKPGGRLLASGGLCGLYEKKMYGERLSVKWRTISAVS